MAQNRDGLLTSWLYCLIFVQLIAEAGDNWYGGVFDADARLILDNCARVHCGLSVRSCVGRRKCCRSFVEKWPGC